MAKKHDFTITGRQSPRGAPCGSVNVTFTDEEFAALLKGLATLIEGAAPAYDTAVLEILYDHFSFMEEEMRKRRG